ncbi:hypothetical protein CAEBREN_04268 [Caenorhabditis brenneri]|uniref:Uncharacterized protein n=1 Tax=Caenorhabditis brenneri TaxID=135651 RepID=G0N1M0_CAEBE|nr:hypothetical protein CAEBREN_04268 [Caenorhabditis brenneri]
MFTDKQLAICRLRKIFRIGFGQHFSVSSRTDKLYVLEFFSKQYLLTVKLHIQKQPKSMLNNCVAAPAPLEPRPLEVFTFRLSSTIVMNTCCIYCICITRILPGRRRHPCSTSELSHGMAAKRSKTQAARLDASDEKELQSSLSTPSPSSED